MSLNHCETPAERAKQRLWGQHSPSLVSADAGGGVGVEGLNGLVSVGAMTAIPPNREGRSSLGGV